MLTFILTLVFISAVAWVLTFFPLESVERPRLQALLGGEEFKPKKKKSFFSYFRQIAIFNKPLCLGPLGRRIGRDLAMARVDMVPEEFFLLKEAAIFGIMFLTF